MDIKNSLDELMSYSSFGIKLGLDNMKSILKGLGNPEKNYKTIHIAGTNGKGSTASILEASLIEAGFNVGKYTSPHILRFNERIRLNGIEISDNEIVENFLKVKTVIKENSLEATFFEVTTAIMFLYFSDKKIDYLVLEVGLGGRYDATNVVDSNYAVITSISMDHLGVLGNSLKEIAYEKAGIIKNSSKTFYIDKNKDISDEILKMDQNAKNVKDIFNSFNSSVDKNTLKTHVKVDNNEFNLSLFGKFQGDNFLLAYSVLKDIGVDDKYIQKASSKIYWPGRFEIINNNPLTVLDGAHNEDSAIKLYENLNTVTDKKDNIIICSMLKDKEIEKVIEIFSKAADEIIFTSLNNYSRGLTGAEVAKNNRSFSNYKIIESIKDAYEFALKQNKNIIIAGSFYLISEFRSTFNENN